MTSIPQDGKKTTIVLSSKAQEQIRERLHDCFMSGGMDAVLAERETMEVVFAEMERNLNGDAAAVRQFLDDVVGGLTPKKLN